MSMSSTDSPTGLAAELVYGVKPPGPKWPHDTVMLPGLVMQTSPLSLAAQQAATSLVATSCTVVSPLATGTAAWFASLARCATGATTRSSSPVMPTIVPAGRPAAGAAALGGV